MFWGLIMEPGKKYSQTVEKSFHVSQAALDLDSAQSHPVQVLLGFENRNYLLCTLNKDKWVQVPLDLNFQVGDKVSFATNGPGHVHLTGYLVPEDDYDMDLEEEEDEEDQEDEEVPELLPISNKKRKADNKLEQKNKKVKSDSLTAKLLEESFPNDSDEDDSDVNLSDLLENENSDEEVEEEEDAGEDDDDDEEDDDDDDEDVEEEEEQPVQKKEKLKQNGIVKPEKQKEKQKPNKQENQQQKSPKQKGNKKTIQGGVIIEDLKVGEGPVATVGRQVQVYYEGKLQSNNKIFDSSKKGSGFRFRLGKQEVIKGWDVGVAGMKVGGKRRITCPPNMAYGAQGSPPVIPPQSTLVFEVELKHVK